VTIQAGAGAAAVSEVVPEFLPAPCVVRNQHRDRDRGLRRVLFAADAVALTVSLFCALALAGDRPHPLLEALWIVPTLPLWAFLFRGYGLYWRPLRSFEPTHLDDISSLLHALIIGTLGLWLFYKVMPVQRLGFSEIIIFGVSSLFLIAVLRVAVRIIHISRLGPERVLAVAPIDDVNVLQRKLRNHPEYEMVLVAAALTGGHGTDPFGLSFVPSLEAIEPILLADEVDHVIVQIDSDFIPQERVAELMRTCLGAGVRFSTFPKVRSLLYPGVEVNHIEGTGFLSYHPPVLSRVSRLLKRGMDVVVAGLLLTVFAIPMAVAAAAIKLDSPGPVFYRQTRVGKNSRRFQLFKFRTMVPGADKRTADLMTLSRDPDWLIIDDDPRITRVGRFLRRTSLDELPQLWNVLKGEMSMVGPRPLSELDDQGVRGWERHRLDLTPGVTGYWQVLGRNSIPFREMVEIDYAYVSSWSLLQDMKLLVKTVPVVLTGRGAQ
jgi:exopolysaccharide biosynthesis polyprenyl glycosylphosphotransferase